METQRNTYEDEYDEHSNNIYFKNGKKPGFFGWLLIFIQIGIIAFLIKLYLSPYYIRGNISDMYQGFRKHFLRTLVGVGIFLFLTTIMLFILKASGLIHHISFWFVSVLIATPTLVPFIVFDALVYMVKTPEKGISEI